MWRKEDVKTQAVPEVSTTPAPENRPARTGSAASEPLLSPNAAACISQGIRIKGEVIGSEDLFVDGQVDGKLDIGGGSVTVGPNGKVKADISARELIVRGEVTGKVAARDRVQLWSTGRVHGQVQTARLAIEDGAILRGNVEAGKPLSKSKDTSPATQTAAATAAATSGKAI